MRIIKHGQNMPTPFPSPPQGPQDPTVPFHRRETWDSYETKGLPECPKLGSGGTGTGSQVATPVRYTYTCTDLWYSLSTRPHEQAGFGEIPVLQLPGSYKRAWGMETTGSFICDWPCQPDTYPHPMLTTGPRSEITGQVEGGAAECPGDWAGRHR